MEIILKQDVENLVLEFDIVNVKSGFARNYLIPKGLALLANDKNKTDLENILKEREAEEAKQISEATSIIEKLKNTPITIKAKVGTADKLFGSINNATVSEELAKAGVDLDKKYIKIPGNTIRRLGKYTVKIRLHRKVEYDYSFDVVPLEK